MGTPYILNPYQYLIGLVTEGQGPNYELEDDLESVAENVRATLKNSEPPFLQRFFKFYQRTSYLGIVGERFVTGEKLLRMIWRGDYKLEVVPGEFRHFKGGLYLVEKTGLLLEGPKEETGVIYSSVEDHLVTFIRPLREWCHVIQWPDGELRLRFMPKSVVG